MDESILSAGEFKATCLKLMDEVAATGKGITITKRGKPVARLVPVTRASAATGSIFGALAGTVTILGDIVSSIDDSDWEAAALQEWDELHKPAKRPRQRRRKASRSTR